MARMTSLQRVAAVIQHPITAAVEAFKTMAHDGNTLQEVLLVAG